MFRIWGFVGALGVWGVLKAFRASGFCGVERGLGTLRGFECKVLQDVPFVFGGLR